MVGPSRPRLFDERLKERPEAVTRLERRNAEADTADWLMHALTEWRRTIKGERVANVRFAANGVRIDLEDGTEIECRIIVKRRPKAA